MHRLRVGSRPAVVIGAVGMPFITAAASAQVRPNAGQEASGVGDTEVTLQYLLHREGRWPALALGGEIKLPTAKNSLIGTGRADYAGILIASRKFGDVDTHLNLSYTFVGQPVGAYDNTQAVLWRPGITFRST